MAIELISLFIIGNIAGFINVMAGGGSSLVLPALIFLGLDGTLANGTNRIAILLQNLFAIASFKKESYGEFKLSLWLSLWTLPGAILGAIYATKIEGKLFEIILAFVLVGIVVTMLIPSKQKQALNAKPSIFLYPALFGVGLFGGFIQVGVGFIITAALNHLMHLDLVRVNMHKVFIVFIYTVPALFIFHQTGNINWEYGLAVAAGSSTGGWWAAKLAVKRGEKIIKLVLAIAMLLIAGKLIWF